jgi:hypothetical protein
MTIMTFRLKHQLKKIFDWYESTKGKRIVILSVEQESDQSYYLVKTNAGFEIKITCVELEYVVKYRHILGLFNRKETLYKVVCECGESTPKEISDKLSEPKTVPHLTSIFTSSNYRKQAAIQIYLDTLVDELTN